MACKPYFYLPQWVAWLIVITTGLCLVAVAVVVAWQQLPPLT